MPPVSVRRLQRLSGEQGPGELWLNLNDTPLDEPPRVLLSFSCGRVLVAIEMSVSVIVLLGFVPRIKSKLSRFTTVEGNHPTLRPAQFANKLLPAFVDGRQRGHVDRDAWRVIE